MRPVHVARADQNSPLFCIFSFFSFFSFLLKRTDPIEETMLEKQELKPRRRPAEPSLRSAEPRRQGPMRASRSNKPDRADPKSNRIEHLHSTKAPGSGNDSGQESLWRQ
jgi:hypothetical protein